MSAVLYSLIHNRVEATKPNIKITVDNYEIWIAHWLKCTEELAREFDKEGLLETAKTLRAIGEANRRICK